MEKHGIPEYAKLSPANVGDRTQIASDATRVGKWAAAKATPQAVAAINTTKAAPALSVASKAVTKAVPYAAAVQTGYDAVKLALNPQERMQEFQKNNQEAGTGVMGAVERVGQGLSQPVTSIATTGKAVGQLAQVTADNLYSMPAAKAKARDLSLQLPYQGSNANKNTAKYVTPSYSKEENGGSMVSKGTIDLANRPTYKNQDGSISTVLSTSFDTDKGVMLVPRVIDNKTLLEPKDAFEHAKKTGQHLGVFSTREAADSYAEKLHKDQATQYLPTPPPSK
jgi:hypothetical protein